MTSSLTYVAYVILDGLPISIAQMNRQFYQVKGEEVIVGLDLDQYLDASCPGISRNISLSSISITCFFHPCGLNN